jgi:L-alanine-DL-glutamate epimerase-like enolase superfamily enzyme
VFRRPAYDVYLSLLFFPIKARAGVEMALIDAVANSIRIPLWRLFGGASDCVTTDITVRLYHNLCTGSRMPVDNLIRIAVSLYLNIDSNCSPN